MSSSREESPDWLRCFQGPTQAVTLLSDSDSPPDSPVREDESSKLNSQSKKPKSEPTTAKKRKRGNNSEKEGKSDGGKIAKRKVSEKPIKSNEANHSVLALSSDSESGPDTSPLREDYPEKDEDEDGVPIDSLNKASKSKSPKKRVKTEDDKSTVKKKVASHINKGNDGDVEAADEEISAKNIGPHVPSSRVPLVLSEKVQRSKALVECEGDAIDLSGDVGAVGRLVISDNPSSNQDMFLDLKGTIYKTTIVPSRTFCVVSFGQTEAKIEAIMNDFIQLKPQSNVYEAETMVEGTLEGFSFGSEDEADNLPKDKNNQADQNEGGDEQANGKAKGKAEKKSGPVRKKGKAAGGKPAKKVKKKAQTPKRTKAKK